MANVDWLLDPPTSLVTQHRLTHRFRTVMTATGSHNLDNWHSKNMFYTLTSLKMRFHPFPKLTKRCFQSAAASGSTHFAKKWKSVSCFSGCQVTLYSEFSSLYFVKNCLSDRIIFEWAQTFSCPFGRFPIGIRLVGANGEPKNATQIRRPSKLV